MKTLVFTLIATVLLLQYGNAQDTGINITGTFSPKDRSAAYISVLGNTNSKDPVIAQAKVTDGKFTLQLPKNLPIGVYKFGFASQDTYTFYFVHDGETTYHIDFENKNNAWRFNSNTGKNHSYLSTYWKQKDSLILPIQVLYYFAQNYPEKTTNIYNKNAKVLSTKIKQFKAFRKKAITAAPVFAKEILTHNKLLFHNPQWDAKTIEDNFIKTLWESVPKNDTLFYNKPYFFTKLEATFDNLLDAKGKTKPELEKYEILKDRLAWLLQNLAQYPDKHKYYNLCIRYFSSKGYPYLLELIDTYVDKNQLLTENEKLGYEYRTKQQLLVEQIAPKIPTQDTPNFLDTVNAKYKRLVFVAGNTPFSFELLTKLKKDTTTKTDTKVVAVLLIEDKASVQKFKNLYPNWEICGLDKDTINTVAERYNLFYVPSVFTLDSENRILKIHEPFQN